MLKGREGRCGIVGCVVVEADSSHGDSGHLQHSVDYHDFPCVSPVDEPFAESMPEGGGGAEEKGGVLAAQRASLSGRAPFFYSSNVNDFSW